jgi:RNA polymerase sigma-70 factor, ECF subfamily
MPNATGAEAESETRGLADLTDEELVDQFLARLKSDRSAAHLCFEVIIGRYQWLINHIVRNSHYRFPAWDSADDVIARVIFKVYRGLALWRKQGKLSSFIARIATSEMIDTIRRVGRDKSWNPRKIAADPDADDPPVVETAAATGPSPEALAVSREQSDIVEQLLADVCRDWKDSAIVNEYMIAEHSAKEIADKYDMTEDVVYQRARRLRVRLMKWLKERGITSAEQLLGGGTAAKRS